MDRINQILSHPTYNACLEEITHLEQDRIFCKHDMVHFLDVARIAYILNLENGDPIPKDIIYAAALLHDIGRHLQYMKGQPHHEASSQIAPDILMDCGYRQEEIHDIIDAILGHRNSANISQKGLSGYIYKADKASRACLSCPAQEQCNWPDSKKNLLLIY